MRTKNVFESSIFCYIFCKLSNLLFITIKRDSSGRYYAETTRLDKIRFFFGLLIGIWYNLYFTETDKVESNRAIIFEIAIFLSSKFHFSAQFMIMVGTFLYRNEYFDIVQNLHWIDTKVRGIFHRE
jgi:hypothetical protein